jgi:prepilin-type N-terminal cleavage/methylation domain-containing protein
MLSTILQRYQAGQRAKERGEEREDGFTLIELLIVIVVLGILAAVTVFALSGTTAKSAQAACDADAQTVNVALAAYNVQNPSTAATAPTTNGTLPVPSNLVSGGYLQSWPSNNSHYTIGLNGTTAGSQNVTVTVTGGTALAYPAVAPATDPCAAAK